MPQTPASNGKLVLAARPIGEALLQLLRELGNLVTDFSGRMPNCAVQKMFDTLMPFGVYRCNWKERYLTKLPEAMKDLATKNTLARETGQPVDATSKLIVPMIERFMATDRGFAIARLQLPAQRSRQGVHILPVGPWNTAGNDPQNGRALTEFACDRTKLPAHFD